MANRFWRQSAPGSRVLALRPAGPLAGLNARHDVQTVGTLAARLITRRMPENYGSGYGKNFSAVWYPCGTQEQFKAWR